MTIQESNDEELRRIIYDKDKVIVKFFAEDCEVCRVLEQPFRKLSSNPAYKNITFLRMDASENPVSSKEVSLSGTPFFATYNKGTLVECGLLSEEKDIKEMLDRLLLQK
ncbi:MAG: thioredoxin family protein [Hymenobacteraceae bacterium]|nr:thioredoxin family protein [Hymenobacteraceae bacterium]MDX5395555.1 thioredoxin family protein [Hymenobacteraceae bacterium]MDX5443981.1 thioredoxin family protein [Hymenobacteraceae bacterium]MDX5511609.1 thioredoxin family protein [Hymenobacteraceae bacterium]